MWLWLNQKVLLCSVGKNYIERLAKKVETPLITKADLENCFVAKHILKE